MDRFVDFLLNAVIPVVALTAFGVAVSMGATAFLYLIWTGFSPETIFVARVAGSAAIVLIVAMMINDFLEEY